MCREINDITKFKDEYGRCNNVRPKTFNALRISIMYINVCKKSLFKGIRNIYLLAFFLDPLFIQISVVVFCLLYETSAQTGVLRFFSRISNGTSHN